MRFREKILHVSALNPANVPYLLNLYSQRMGFDSRYFQLSDSRYWYPTDIVARDKTYANAIEI
ncbi:MAG: hypothetical protein ACXQTL_06295, partial [Methanosarcinales archaeon]